MEPERIRAEDVKRRLDAGQRIFFLDSRAADVWEKAGRQIPGSIRVPPDRVDAHLNTVPKGGLIVPYCTWPQEHSSARVAQALLDHGWTDVHPLLGGFDAWQKAGYPTEPRHP